MRILFDAHLSINEMTGIGHYINQLLKALIDADHKNEYMVLLRKDLSPTHPLKKLQASNLSKIAINFKGLLFKQHIWMKDILERYAPDVYHHPHFDLPLGVGKNTVITIHDAKYLRHTKFFPELGLIKQRYIKLMFWSSIRRAAQIISVSEFTANDIIDLFNVDPAKMSIIHHGIELTSETNSVAHANLSSDRLGISKPFILFVGERRPHKNIVHLIDAYQTVQRELNLDIKLAIVGKAYKNFKLPEQIIEQKNLKNSVIIMDYVDNNALEELYHNAELLILPSLYEGFGFPILEAMKFNLPVIGSNLTSIPEIIGNAGLLVDPYNSDDIAEKIAKVLTDNKLREELIRLGKKRVKSFSWNEAAIKTLNVYEKVFHDQ